MISLSCRAFSVVSPLEKQKKKKSCIIEDREKEFLVEFELSERAKRKKNYFKSRLREKVNVIWQ